jgi:hypothetical protein
MARNETIADALRQVEADYPAWHAWPGIPAGLVYARRSRTSPPAVVRASTVAELRRQIAQWEASHG